MSLSNVAVLSMAVNLSFSFSPYNNVDFTESSRWYFYFRWKWSQIQREHFDLWYSTSKDLICVYVLLGWNSKVCTSCFSGSTDILFFSSWSWNESQTSFLNSVFSSPEIARLHFPSFILYLSNRFSLWWWCFLCMKADHWYININNVWKMLIGWGGQGNQII